MEYLSIANLVAGISLIAAAGLLFVVRKRNSKSWRATVTPLASIIGSGFLVSLPLLAEAVGVNALFAMTALIVLSFAIGGAIRFNIIHGEPLFDDDSDHHAVTVLERLSHLALAFAYLISVTFYLSLLSAFLLKGIGFTDPFVAKIVTTAILLFIALYGFLKGLRGLESIEEYAVGLKLAVIAAVLAALAWYNANLLLAGQWKLHAVSPPFTWHTAQLLLGMLIVVQGFETSRFLKGAYPPKMRARTMRNAQLISGAVYIAFFALATVTFNGHYDRGDVAAVTTMLAGIATIVPLMLTAGAVFAQASAAIADAIGGAGLIDEVSRSRIARKHAYPAIAAVGIAITWSVNVFTIIALASRAFALYYMTACAVAVVVALSAPKIGHPYWRATWYAFLGLIAFGIVIFGIPAEGGG